MRLFFLLSLITAAGLHAETGRSAWLRYAELRGDMDGVKRVVRDGAERARSIARPVMAEVRRALGLYVGQNGS